MTDFDIVVEGFHWLDGKGVERGKAHASDLDLPSVERRADLRTAIPRMYNTLKLEELKLWWCAACAQAR
jgi:hypothetical protein